MAKDAMAGGKGMSPRKAMAMGEASTGGGSFGCESFDSMQNSIGMHPDAKARTGQKGHMADGERAAGPGIHHTAGHHPAQAAPNHGPHHVDGYGNHHGRR